jgi:hypothetical protein
LGSPCKPFAHIVLEKLLGPNHSSKRLPLHLACIDIMSFPAEGIRKTHRLLDAVV